MSPASSFGDEQTADVILLISPSDGDGEMRPAPLHLHSQALRRSEYFAARLSERWAVDGSRPVELTLSHCKNPDSYKRCIELMYVPHKIKQTAFTGVPDALDVLEVAAELLFHDCVNACMCFLEAVPWSSEDEIAIRNSVASWHLQLTTDLAARLSSPESIPDYKPVEIMKDVLGELLSLVSNGAPAKAREITERVLQANIQPSTSPAFAVVNEMALFKELHNNLDLLKIQLRKFANFFSWNSHQVYVASSSLRWLLEELFVLQIADVAVKTFAEENDLAQLMVSRIYQNPFTDTLFCILARMLLALQNGEVIISRSIRLSLVTTWLPVIAKLGDDIDDVGKDNSLQHDLEEGLCAVVGTLPVVDQEEIFKIWIGTCLKSRKAWPDLSIAFDSWCNKLRHAQEEQDFRGGSTRASTTNDEFGVSVVSSLKPSDSSGS